MWPRKKSDSHDLEGHTAIEAQRTALTSLQDHARHVLDEVRSGIRQKEAQISDICADEQAALQTARQMRLQAIQQMKEASSYIEQIRAVRDEVRSVGALRNADGAAAIDSRMPAASESAIADIARARDSALAELRAAFAQMNERLEHAGSDLAAQAQELRSAGAEAIEEVRLLVAAARLESNDRSKKIRELWSETHAAVRQCESAGQRIVQGAQDASAAVIEHANSVHSNATCEARTIHDRCDATLREAESVRTRIDAAADVVRQIHGDSLSRLKDAAASQATAQARSEELLQQVKAMEQQIGRLIAGLHDGIRESGEKAAVLAEISRKTSGVVRQLATVGCAAANEKTAIESANLEAEQTMRQLKHHTQRVGQLVGIIRQLYGAMDARAGRIRERLEAAEGICRDIPREVDALRGALSDSDQKTAAVAVRAAENPALPIRRLTRGRAAATTAPKVIPRPSHVEPLPFAEGTLGEIVQRNQKLNAWLKNVLGETRQAEPGSPDPVVVGTTDRRQVTGTKVNQ